MKDTGVDPVILRKALKKLRDWKELQTVKKSVVQEVHQSEKLHPT
jgi:hypothetical protein